MLATLFASTLLRGAASDYGSDFESHIRNFQKAVLLGQEDIASHFTNEEIALFVDDYLVPWILRSNNLDILKARLEFFEKFLLSWEEEGQKRAPANFVANPPGDAFRDYLKPSTEGEGDPFSKLAELPVFGGRPALIVREPPSKLGEVDSLKARQMRKADSNERLFNIESYLPRGNNSKIVSWDWYVLLYREHLIAPREPFRPVIFYSIGPRQPLLDRQYLLDGALITGREWLKAQGESD
jgi:hypothetical protein